jgi:mannosyltransferase
MPAARSWRAAVAVVGALASAMAASALLRTGALDAGYWIDEAISVGIASRDLVEIPRSLRMDGSPPLYYLLLHGWMEVAGTGEVATRTLSLIFALLAVPVAWWAGAAVVDRRAGALAAAVAAGCPFLTYYAQETRMYSLVAVLSLLASASFVLGFVRGRRCHVVLLGAWLTLLLYTHNWALFLAGGMAVAWLTLWRAGRVDGRHGALLGAAVLALYAPWIPSVAFQAAHTGAPWAARPSPLWLAALPLAAALRPRDQAGRTLLAIAAATFGLAWIATQFEPAWSLRYFAVLLGPLVLARPTAAAAAAVVSLALVASPAPAVKSNVRAVASASGLQAGDLVISTQPEQVPALHRYLPDGVVYLTPLGVVPDPAVVDWREGLVQLRAGRAERRLLPVLDHLARGTRIVLVTPLRTHTRSPWARAVRLRTWEWRAALHRHPRLRTLGRVSAFPPGRSGVDATIFVLIS